MNAKELSISARFFPVKHRTSRTHCLAIIIHLCVCCVCDHLVLNFVFNPQWKHILDPFFAVVFKMMMEIHLWVCQQLRPLSQLKYKVKFKKTNNNIFFGFGLLALLLDELDPNQALRSCNNTNLDRGHSFENARQRYERVASDILGKPR